LKIELKSNTTWSKIATILSIIPDVVVFVIVIAIVVVFLSLRKFPEAVIFPTCFREVVGSKVNTPTILRLL
jgi:hypothetical protein